MWPRRRMMRRINAGRMGARLTSADPRLLKAIRLFEIGEYASAAELFQNIAEDYLQRQVPPAPHLFIMSGNAWMKGNEIENATNAFQKGLGLMVERKKWERVKISSERIFTRLIENGHADKQIALKTWLESQIPSNVRSLPIWKKKNRLGTFGKDLPSNCPQCGAPVDADDLEWSNAKANCNYCGCLLN
jgi:hypothetical protein